MAHRVNINIDTFQFSIVKKKWPNWQMAALLKKSLEGQFWPWILPHRQGFLNGAF